MNLYKFSIVIPAYKSAFLAECVNSILAQTYSNYEIVVVNDASPDDIDGVMRGYSDSRIRYYVNECNCGAVDVVENWNKCLEYCSGEYVICMGDDDRLLPCCLETYNSLINKYPGLHLFHAWTEIINGKSEFVGYQHPRPEYETCMSLLWNRWNGRSLQFIGDFCFEVKQLRECGGFYKLPLAWGSDDISATRAASINGVANTQVPCFQYRMNASSITNTGNFELKMEAIRQEKEWFGLFLKDYGSRCLDEIDGKFLKCAFSEFEHHYKAKYKYQLSVGFIQKPNSFLIWLFSRRKKYNISFSMVIVAGVLSLKSMFSKKQ